MTLLITVLTKRTIYQSADFRLTNPDTGAVITDKSTKLITLNYPPDWHGFVAYTGIGSVPRGLSEFVDPPDLAMPSSRKSSKAKRSPFELIDTSRFVMQWLDGLNPASPADVVERIRDRGSEWLSKLEAKLGRRPRHTFILATFDANRPQLAVISNFEDCFGRNDADAAPQLSISSMRLRARPRIVVSGWKSALAHRDRRCLERLIDSIPDDPARVRRMLAQVNAAAARSSDEAQKWISPECSVVSVRADGQAQYHVDGSVDIHAMSMGMRMPSWREIAKLLGVDGGRVVGAAFSSSKPHIPYEPCRPQIVTPPDSGGYIPHELSHPDFVSCQARDVNDAGVVVGSGNPPGRPADYLMWSAALDGEVQPCRLIGQPGSINDAGEVAATVRMKDGSEHAVRWKGDNFIDLGTFRGRDSGALAINASGLVVGWVSIDPVNRGQGGYRPAAWSDGQVCVIDDCFGCNWGEAVDVNNEGFVLVRCSMGMFEYKTFRWNFAAGTCEHISGATGIVSKAITAGGLVLGGTSKNVAHVSRPGQAWEPLGTPPGFNASAMNDAGDAVGFVVRDGYPQPWLRLATGETHWLPYYAHHSCFPCAISNAGVVVGYTTTDHGSHALVWQKQ